jgi:hypothetical protein
MHPYSTNSPGNPKLIGVLAIVASSVSAGVGALANQIHNSWGWTIGGVSTLTCFGILHLVFDRFLWRRKIARKFLLVPDLNGTWECRGKTILKSGTAQDLTWSGTVTIRQSWSRLVVVLKSGQSTSRSIAASLYQEPGTGYRLIYHYDNRPKADEATLLRHSGQCDLVFSDDTESASGEYFTGQGRMTLGTMQLTRGLAGPTA